MDPPRLRKWEIYAFVASAAAVLGIGAYVILHSPPEKYKPIHVDHKTITEFVERPAAAQTSVDYFATVPMWTGSGMALTSGDFDNDQDLDVIVGAVIPGTYHGRLYFLENDGKGNFTKRKMPP